MPTLHLGASQGVKNPPANARDMGLIPGLGRHLAEGNSSRRKPTPVSCLENAKDRVAWRASLWSCQELYMSKRLSMHALNTAELPYAH